MSKCLTLSDWTIQRSGPAMTVIGKDEHGKEHRVTGVSLIVGAESLEVNIQARAMRSRVGGSDILARLVGGF